MKIVVAACRNRGIGYKNKLPWSIKKEMQYFKKLTIGDDTEIKYKNNNNNDNYYNKNAVVMGKNTWLSLKKPLPKRDNFILSTSLQTSDITTSSKHSNIHLLRSLDEVRQIEKRNAFMWLFMNIASRRHYTTFAKYGKRLKEDLLSRAEPGRMVFDKLQRCLVL